MKAHGTNFPAQRIVSMRAATSSQIIGKPVGAFVFATLLLSGCGQTGPLYLPKVPEPPKPRNEAAKEGSAANVQTSTTTNAAINTATGTPTNDKPAATPTNHKK